MKKGDVVIWCLWFAVGIAIWLGLRVVLLNYAHMPERAMWLAKESMIENYRYRKGDVIIVGSSRAMAIDPELLRQRYHVRVMNFSVGGATAPSTYFFLKRILKQNPDLEKVYLEFAPINMSSKDTALDASLGENFIRYVATAEEARELEADLPGTWEMYRSIHGFPFSKYVNQRDLLLLESTLVRLRTRGSDADDQRRILQRNGCLLYPDIKEKGPFRERSFEKKTCEYYQKTVSYTKSLPTVSEVYLKKILTLLREHGVEYVIFFSPAPTASQRFQKMGFGRTYDLFRDLPCVRRNILLLDSEYFSEPSHVNGAGSQRYSDFFMTYVVNGQETAGETINIFE